MAENAHRLFCFGLGYSARALIAELRHAQPGQWRFSGTARNPAAAEDGIEMQAFDGSAPLPQPGALLAADHVLISIPPDAGPPNAGGDPVLRHCADVLARHRGLKWLGYLSTTGVYGDRQGEWVDEAAAIAPSHARGQRRADAEAGWLDLWRRHGMPVHLFRLAGIYGPGRNALVSLRQGKAHRAVKPGQVFSRIHVQDLAAVLAASMARPDPGAAYNVADDEPAPPQDVVAHAASLLGIEPPPEVPLEQAGLSPMAQSFYLESKRVANGRIKQELGVTLRYPNYRDGLAALLREF